MDFSSSSNPSLASNTAAMGLVDPAEKSTMAEIATLPIWPLGWGHPLHAQSRADLLRGLHGGRPFFPQASYYAPALLPINTSLVSGLHGWLQSQPAHLESDELVQTLATLQASVTNHYRLCKPLALQTFSAQRFNTDHAQAMEAELLEWRKQAQLMEDLFLGVLHWPKACWQAFEWWMASTLSILLALGHHDAVTHAAQVCRWSVLHAQLSRPDDAWFGLQAAMLGWFHDPKLHVRFSIDNLGTHPVVASLLAQHVLQHIMLIQPLTEGWQACHPNQPLHQAPEALATMNLHLCQAFLTNSDSEYITTQILQPSLGHQLPAELRAEWNDWIERRVNHELEAPPSAELQYALTKTSLDSGFIGLDATLWSHATAWWIEQEGKTVSPAMLYQMVLRGETAPSGADLATQLQPWLQQATLMAETPFVHWRIPGTLLLIHHQETALPELSECLAFADPLMLSPHKILAARAPHEPFIERIRSYLTSLEQNVAGLTTPLGQKLAQQWQQDLLELVGSVAQEHSADFSLPELPHERFYTLNQPESWGTTWPYLSEETLQGAAKLQQLYQHFKTRFDEAEIQFIRQHLGTPF